MGRKPTAHSPLLASLKRGTILYRIHQATLDPLWFGPAPGDPPTFRFDDPKGEYRVCYIGQSVAAACAETFLRDPPVTVVSHATLATRRLASVRLTRDLKVATLHGRGLAHLGVTAHVTTGPYADSQTWSRRLWEHAADIDAILYASRHDNAELCLAVFDRGRSALTVVQDDAILDDPQQLGHLLDQYGVALIA